MAVSCSSTDIRNAGLCLSFSSLSTSMSRVSSPHFQDCHIAQDDDDELAFVSSGCPSTLRAALDTRSGVKEGEVYLIMSTQTRTSHLDVWRCRCGCQWSHQAQESFPCVLASSTSKVSHVSTSGKVWRRIQALSEGLPREECSVGRNGGPRTIVIRPDIVGEGKNVLPPHLSPAVGWTASSPHNSKQVVNGPI